MQTRTYDEIDPRADRRALPEGGPALSRRASWGAILIGALVAVTVGLMLNTLGAALGSGAVDPAEPGQTPSAQTLGVSAGIWLLAANLIALGVGGYLAARLSGLADRTDSVLHGLAVWAVAYLLAAVLLGNVIGGTVSTAFQGVSSVAGGAVQGAGQAVSAVAGPAAQNGAAALDPQALVERARNALGAAGSDPAAMTSEQRNAEIARLLARRVTDGEALPPPERDRLRALVAAEYGIAPEEAERRLAQAEQQATEALETAERQARQAAEGATEAASLAAYLAFGSMLLGALAAMIGARIGTRRVVA